MKNTAIGAYRYERSANNPIYRQSQFLFEAEFEWLPLKLVLETPRSTKIARNAKLVLRGFADGAKRASFHTGLKRIPGEENWYVGDYQEQRDGKKRSHLVVVRIGNCKKRMHVFCFSDLGQTSIRKRVAYALSILDWLKRLHGWD